MACYKRQLEVDGFYISGVVGSVEDVYAIHDYDVVLIAIKNKEKAKSVVDELIFNGVDKDKIRWFDQTEIFWKFAKANGFI